MLVVKTIYQNLHPENIWEIFQLNQLIIKNIWPGCRGPGHLKNFATLDGTQVVALCDLYEDNVKREHNRLKNIILYQLM